MTVPTLPLGRSCRARIVVVRQLVVQHLIPQAALEFHFLCNSFSLPDKFAPLQDSKNRMPLFRNTIKIKNEFSRSASRREIRTWEHYGKHRNAAGSKGIFELRLLTRAYQGPKKCYHARSDIENSRWSQKILRECAMIIRVMRLPSACTSGMCIGRKEDDRWRLLFPYISFWNSYNRMCCAEEEGVNRKMFAGPNCTHLDIAKRLAMVINKRICRPYGTSLGQSALPKGWKAGEVVSIHKSESKAQTQGYQLVVLERSPKFQGNW